LQAVSPKFPKQSGTKMAHNQRTTLKKVVSLYNKKGLSLRISMVPRTGIEPVRDITPEGF
jgi:hypothetical protein